MGAHVTFMLGGTKDLAIEHAMYSRKCENMLRRRRCG